MCPKGFTICDVALRLPAALQWRKDITALQSRLAQNINNSQ